MVFCLIANLCALQMRRINGQKISPDRTREQSYDLENRMTFGTSDIDIFHVYIKLPVCVRNAFPQFQVL